MSAQRAQRESPIRVTNDLCVLLLYVWSRPLAEESHCKLRPKLDNCPQQGWTASDPRGA